ncbi:MAG: hypothetical protein ACRCST_13610 [Turicibacter sp.]
MPKKSMKEPLLFVDSTFKGCQIEEQIFFKTPQVKPEDIINESYVHAFDSTASVSTIKPTQLKNNKMLLEVEGDEQEYEVDSLEYETVNIIIDSVGLDDGYYPEIEDNFEGIKDDYLVQEDLFLKNNTELTDEIRDEEVDTKTLTYANDSYQFNDRNNSEDLSLDEEQLELLSFIQELIRHGSMMKSPVVQLIQTNGQVVSGKITDINNHRITLDNYMDNLVIIELKEVKGLRILNL